ncbi:excalibur calcium-binding domain-containing protein [Kitasatospora sp. NPDC004240]
MHPYNASSVQPAPRSGRNRLLRILLLVFLPPVAAVMVWRSRRLQVAVKVLLTLWCLFMSLFWLGAINGPSETKTTPAPAPTATATSSPTATPSSSPTAGPTPTAAPSPTSTPESPVPTPTPTTPPVVETQAPVVVPTTKPVVPEPERTSAPSAPASVYFKNCDEAKAAGAAPLHRGDPGYRSALDRDGDGVACER